MNAVLQLVDKDATAIGDAYRDYESRRMDVRGRTRETMEAYIKCGQMLAAKKSSLHHGEWLPWLAANAGVLGFEDAATAQRLMKSSNTAPARHLDEDSALALSRKIWGHARNYKSQGTGENEWYTPPEIVDRATAAMGAIDLDPASSADANTTVGALEFYSAADDGLSKTWAGRIWLNPPYSRELMPAFVAHLIRDFESGSVREAILLSHNNTDTKWFQSLAKVASAICFPAKRLKFYRGEDVADPVNGQALFYLGAKRQAFLKEFGDLGVIVEVMNSPPP